MSEVTLTDCADWAKVLVRAAPDGSLADRLGVPHGLAARRSGDLAVADDLLTVGWTPDGWLLLSADEPGAAIVERVESVVDGEFVSVVDVTHGHTVLRLTGPRAADVLAKLCAIDLAYTATPNGTAVRTLLAGITATVIRDDAAGEPSYLTLCDRSYGQYLGDVLADAGTVSR